MKLTKAQREFLCEINRHIVQAVEDYSPARRLVELGLAKMHPQPLGNPTFRPTAEGVKYFRDFLS